MIGAVVQARRRHDEAVEHDARTGSAGRCIWDSRRVVSANFFLPSPVKLRSTCQPPVEMPWLLVSRPARRRLHVGAEHLGRAEDVLLAAVLEAGDQRLLGLVGVGLAELLADLAGSDAVQRSELLLQLGRDRGGVGAAGADGRRRRRRAWRRASGRARARCRPCAAPWGRPRCWCSWSATAAVPRTSGDGEALPVAPGAADVRGRGRRASRRRLRLAARGGTAAAAVCCTVARMFLSCLPGIEMTMFLLAVVTSDSATPKLSTRLRMMETAWLSASLVTFRHPSPPAA